MKSICITVWIQICIKNAKTKNWNFDRNTKHFIGTYNIMCLFLLGQKFFLSLFKSTCNIFGLALVVKLFLWLLFVAHLVIPNHLISIKYHSKRYISYRFRTPVNATRKQWLVHSAGIIASMSTFSEDTKLWS